MQSSRATVINKLIRPSTNKVFIRPYAVHKVYSPKPTTSSQEGLDNNPIITFPRKNKNDIIVQHPELCVITCTNPGCIGKICAGLCGTPLKAESIGHFTHSDKDELEVQKFSDTDFDDNNRPLFIKKYENPHETSGESYNPEADKKKTEKLGEKISKMINDDKNDKNDEP